jgi:hypothetical protein
MNSKAALQLATVAALTVFGSRAAAAVIGDGSPASIRTLAAEIVGAMLGAFIASKVG